MSVNRIVLLALLLITTLMAGCRQGPDEAEVRQAVEAYVEREMQGLFAVRSLAVLDVRMPRDRVAQVLTAVELEVVQDPADFGSSDDPPSLARMLMSLMMRMAALTGGLKKGDRFIEEMVFEFIETDAGWRLRRRLHEGEHPFDPAPPRETTPASPQPAGPAI